MREPIVLAFIVGFGVGALAMNWTQDYQPRGAEGPPPAIIRMPPSNLELRKPAAPLVWALLLVREQARKCA